MATLKSKPIQSKTLFFATSPRTPFKIIPEISLLDTVFRGKIWNSETQSEFYHLLRERVFFEGGNTRYPALAARDRINRVPKSLGFVELPVIGLSDAGEAFLSSDDKETILLRQLLKFQIPSPYHPLRKGAAGFRVKPYLELFRLIYDLNGLSFDELVIFWNAID